MKDKLLANRNLIDTIILIIVGLILGLPLLNSYLNVYIDDGIQHIARASGTYFSMLGNGFFSGNVISSFSNNFGYSWNLFYGPLTAYGIIIFKFICNNFLSAYKLFVFTCLVLSGITMYKFIFSITRNNNAAILAGILYMTFPYHLTDLYTRNALGEFVSFIFIPLVFLGLYNLLYTTENHYYLSIGAIGLILTHNISTAIVAFFSIIYVGINIKKLKETRVKRGLVLNVLFIVLVTSFFWAPLIETKFFTSYQVYEDGMMATPEDTGNHGLTITQLFVTRKDGSFVFELGPHIIVMLAFSIMGIKNVKENIKETYGFFLIGAVISLWISTKYFPWKLLPEEMCIIQFPWRLLQISGFFLSVVCSINVLTLIKKFTYKDVIVISMISILYLMAFSEYIPYDSEIKDITNYTLGHMSGKEVEVVAGTAKAEYLPVKAYDNRFYIATREDYIYILEGKAIIEDEEKKGTIYKAKISTEGAEYTIFELPYIYYPGYEVRLDGTIIDTFETENGFLGFAMGSNDREHLEVKYRGTAVMQISLAVSIISGIVFIIYVWKKH